VTGLGFGLQPPANSSAAAAQVRRRLVMPQ
jgi:hypothetical protein